MFFSFVRQLLGVGLFLGGGDIKLGGWHFLIPMFNKLLYSLHSQGILLSFGDSNILRNWSKIFDICFNICPQFDSNFRRDLFQIWLACPLLALKSQIIVQIVEICSFLGKIAQWAMKRVRFFAKKWEGEFNWHNII